MRLSPSTLGDFVKCPRCWWLDRKHKIGWPRGIFPSLPGGMDRRLKEWYDQHRAHGSVPSELVGKIPGGLFREQALLESWRNWRSGLTVDLGGGVELSGALDDLLHDPATGLYSVIDAKTRGAAPKPGDTEKYYGLQANAYAAMLEGNGRKTSGKAYFVYYWPAAATGGRPFGFHFDTEVVMVETNPQAAITTARNAVACLEGPLPEPSYGCDQCAYVKARGQRMTEIVAEAKRQKEAAAAAQTAIPGTEAAEQVAAGESK